MVSALSYFVMLLGIATSVFSLFEPWLRRLQLYFQFHQMGMDDAAIEKLARIGDHGAYPFDAINFLVGIGIIVIARGLMRRREWARRWWICLCCFLPVEGMWVALDTWDSRLLIILAIIFRLIIVIVSLGVLMSKGARGQFSVKVPNPASPETA